MNTETTKSEETLHSKRIILIIGSILSCVLIISVIAYLSLMKSNAKHIKVAISDTPTSIIASPTSTPTQDPYKDWLSFVDADNSLWFKFPSTWKPAIEAGFNNVSSACHLTGSNFITPEQYKIRFIYNFDATNCGGGGFEPAAFTTYKSISIAGITYYKAYIDGCNNPDQSKIKTCQNNVSQEILTSTLPIPSQTNPSAGKYVLNDYAQLNGNRTLLELSFPETSLDNPKLATFDKEFDTFLTSIKFTEPSANYPTVTDNTGKSRFNGLGISFNFDDFDSTGKVKTSTKVIGNTVYLGDAGLEVKSGQFVQIFQKDPKDSIQTSITKSVLDGYSLTDCPIQVASQPRSGYPENFQTATVSSTSGQADKCPNYINFESDSYFLMDANHSDLLLFFSRGQMSSFTWGDGLVIQ